VKILDWYIIRKFLGTFLYAIAIFIAIAVVFDLTEKIDGMLQRNAPLKEIVFDYYLNFIPYFANLFSPLFVFIAVIFFTSKMAAKSEIVAILSSGTTFMRLLRPYLVAAALIAVGNWYLSGYVLPPANKKRIDFENKYIRDKFYFSKRNIHFQILPGKQAYLETYSSPDSSGFRFTLEHFEEGKLVSKLMCDRIQWNSATKQWRMEGCSRRTNISELQESLEFFAVLDSALGFSPNDFARPLLEDAALLNNAELDALIDRERLKGNARIEPYLVEKYNRVSIPFSAFILTLIGASLSSRKVRGGIGIQLGIGVGLCFVYIMMMRFALTFATKGSLPPIIASWTPNLLFGTLSIYFYRVAPK